MSYEAKTWSAGDTVTSAHLNRMEQGIANAGSTIVHIDNSGTYTVMDKTWQEIYDAMMNGACFVEETGTPYNSILIITGITYNNNKYYVFTSDFTSVSLDYSCSSPNDYPEHSNVS